MSDHQAQLLAYTDLSVGTILGVYTPLILFARNGDCFSNFFSISEAITGYHTYFDGDGLPTKPLGIALFTINFAFTLFGIYNTVAVCTTQYKNEQTIGWLDWFSR